MGLKFGVHSIVYVSASDVQQKTTFDESKTKKDYLHGVGATVEGLRLSVELGVVVQPSVTSILILI